MAKKKNTPAPARNPDLGRTLTPEEKKKFNTIRRNKGADAAKEFRTSLNANTGQAPVPAPVLAPPQGAVEPVPVVPNTLTPTGPVSPLQPRLEDETERYLDRAGNQAPFDPNANNPFGLTTDFSGIQDRVYNDAVARFQRDQGASFDRQNEALRQQLANQGLTPDSPQYMQQMEAFARNRAAAEENAIGTAFRESIGASKTALDGQLAGNKQAYDQLRGVYDEDFKRATTLAPTATGLGTTQYTEGSTGLRTNAALDVQKANTTATLEEQRAARIREDATKRYLGDLDARTRTRTAGAGSLSVNDQIAIARARGEEDRNTLGFSAGLNAGQSAGNETSTSDIAGQIIGAGVGGITSGVGANLGKNGRPAQKAGWPYI